MKPLAFEDLAALPLVPFYETAFRKATGVTLRLVPAEGPAECRKFAPSGNAFCVLLASSPGGCKACLETEERVQRRAARKLNTQQASCYAGLTVVAAPVVVGQRHVATLLSGQVLRREPT